MDAAAKKKLLKKQERQKKKAKSLARKQEKQPNHPPAAAQIHANKKRKTGGGGDANTNKNETLATAKVARFEYEGDDKFLTPSHPQFNQLVKVSYQGFVHDPAETIDPKFHRIARKAFETLRDKSYFQYDVVMAGGKNLSRTFVRRTLVGDPGITYKYLGLRIFAHSWTGTAVAPWFKQIHALNGQLIVRTQSAMQRASNVMGSCEYNLTLINYMEPLTNWDLGLKDEETYGLGKTSVSWHADSSLQDFSAIAVYNCMMEDPHKKKKKPKNKTTNKKRKGLAGHEDEDDQEREWRIALRLSPDGQQPPADAKKGARKPSPSAVRMHDGAASAPPPAVSMATRDGDLYYLLGDFNHDHQHMVLTGSTVRVSTTHRVAVDSDSTLASILARLQAAYDLSAIATAADDSTVLVLTPQQVLKEQTALTEVEMEWIRQYWLQGKQHDVQHVDWQKPMRQLEMDHWRRLETRTKQVLDMVLHPEIAQRQDDQDHISWQLSDRLKVLNVLLQELTLRHKRRNQFRQRMLDKAYRRIAPEYQPVERPRFHEASPLPHDLAPHIQALESLKRTMKTK